MPRQLQSMVIAITGASAGIGRALAIELAARGAKLALCARRIEVLNELNRDIGGGHLVQAVDVADPAACAAFVAATITRYGRIDTLVCNAGYGIMRSVAETTESDWQAIMATNVYGTTACIRAALPTMRAQDVRDHYRAQVMIVSSCLARRSGPKGSAYAATKAAQLCIAESLRVELRSEHIAVTSVHPIGTDTEFFTVAEQLSQHHHVRSAMEPHQTAACVAKKMAAAIRRPRRELWPFIPARWLFGLMVWWPGLGDWFMGKRR